MVNQKFKSSANIRSVSTENQYPYIFYKILTISFHVEVFGSI